MNRSDWFGYAFVVLVLLGLWVLAKVLVYLFHHPGPGMAVCFAVVIALLALGLPGAARRDERLEEWLDEEDQ